MGSVPLTYRGINTFWNKDFEKVLKTLAKLAAAGDWRGWYVYRSSSQLEEER